MATSHFLPAGALFAGANGPRPWDRLRAAFQLAGAPLLPSSSPFADAAASAQPNDTPPDVSTCSQRGSGGGRPTIAALAAAAEAGAVAGGTHALAVAPAPCAPWVTGSGDPPEDPTHNSSLAGGPAAAAAEGVQAQHAGSMSLPGPAQMPHKARRLPALPTILSEVSLVGLDERGAWRAPATHPRRNHASEGGARTCTYAARAPQMGVGDAGVWCIRSALVMPRHGAARRFEQAVSGITYYYSCHRLAYSHQVLWDY